MNTLPSTLAQTLQTKSSCQIDWNVVGTVTDIKANAARMRFYRLRNAIEGPASADTDEIDDLTPSGTPTETPVNTPSKKTPKKASAKKTADHDASTKENPTKRKKKEVSDDKVVKKVKKEKDGQKVQPKVDDDVQAGNMAISDEADCQVEGASDDEAIDS